MYKLRSKFLISSSMVTGYSRTHPGAAGGIPGGLGGKGGGRGGEGSDGGDIGT